MNKLRLSAVNFIRKRWSNSFNNGIVYNRVVFKCICVTVLRQNTERFHKPFTRATESGMSMGGWIFRTILPINVPKCQGGKIFVFLTRNYQNHQYSTIWNLVFTFPLRILLKLWKLSFKKDIITAKTVSQLKSLENAKSWDLPCKWKIWS